MVKTAMLHCLSHALIGRSCPISFRSRVADVHSKMLQWHIEPETKTGSKEISKESWESLSRSQELHLRIEAQEERLLLKMSSFLFLSVRLRLEVIADLDGNQGATREAA